MTKNHYPCVIKVYPFCKENNQVFQTIDHLLDRQNIRPVIHPNGGFLRQLDKFERHLIEDSLDQMHKEAQSPLAPVETNSQENGCLLL